MAVAGVAMLGYGSLSKAVTYTYLPTGAATDYWASGTAAGWSATPGNNSATQLDFYGVSNVGNTTSNNNIGNAFQVNVMELDNFANPSSPTTETIGNDSINFVNGASIGMNGGTTQNGQLYFNAQGGNTTYSFTATVGGNFTIGGGGTANLNFTTLVGNTTVINSAAFTTGNATAGVLINYGEGTITLTGNSGVVYGNGTGIFGGTGLLNFAPAGTGGNVNIAADTGNGSNGNVALSGAIRLYSGVSMELNAGSNTSATLAFGNTLDTANYFNQGNSYATLEFIAGHGLANLGTTEKVVFPSASGSINSVLEVVTGVGIINPEDVVADGADGLQTGDFALYTAATAGTGSTSDTGLQAVSVNHAVLNGTNGNGTYLTSFAGGNNTCVVELGNTNASISAATTVYSLAVGNSSGGATVTLGAYNLTIGSGAAGWAFSNGGGLILNGGTIGANTTDTGTLNFGGGAIAIYTSLANGTINSKFVGGNNDITKFGPGVLFLKSPANFNQFPNIGAIDQIDSGGLDVGTLATGTSADTTGSLPAAMIFLTGGVLEANGNFNRFITNTNTNASSYFIGWGDRNNDVAGGGGFAAKGGSLTVNLNLMGAPFLFWGAGTGQPQGFVGDGYSLLFGSNVADSQVILQNPIDLGTNSINYYREINVNAGVGTASAKLNGVISDQSGGGHGLLKDGNGTLYLAAANTFTGKTMVANGLLDLQNSLALQNSTLASNLVAFDASVASGNFTLGGLTGAGNITLANNAGSPTAITLSVGNNNISTPAYAGILSGAGNLTKVGMGILTLTGANTYTGITTLNSGEVALGVAETAGTSGPLGANTAVGAIVLNGGYLQYTTSANTYDYSARFSTAANQQYNVDTNQTVTWSTALTSSGGALTKIGTGTVKLAAAETYTGATNVNGGTLTVNTNAGSLNTSSAINIASTGTLNFDNVGATGAISKSFGTLSFVSGDGAVNITNTAGQNQAITFASLAPRPAGVGQDFGNGFTATNGFNLTGQPTGFIDQGSFAAGNNYAWYDAGGFIRGINYASDAGAYVVPASTASIATTGVAVGGGNTLYVQASGAAGNVTAQGNATFSTMLFIASGTATQGFTLASGTTLTVNGLLRQGDSSGNTTISGGTGSGIQAANNAEMVIRGTQGNDIFVINTPILANGNNALTKVGASTLVLEAANTYTGPTYLTDGYLDLANSLALQYSTLNVTTANTINTGNDGLLFDTLVGNATYFLGGLSGSGNLSFYTSNGASNHNVNVTVGNNNASTTYTGNIVNGNLTKIGSGTLTFTYNNMTLSSPVTISGGTLQFGNGTAGYDGSLNCNIADNANLTFNNYGTVYYTQVISGNGTLTKAGAGEIFLTSASISYTGTTYVNAGTINLWGAETAGSHGPLGNSAYINPGSIVLNGGILQYSTANQYDYSGRFSTAANQQYNVDTNAESVNWGNTTAGNVTALTSVGGELTKIGTGNLTLSGANTYTGNTTLIGGEIKLNVAETPGTSGPLGEGGTINLNGGYLGYTTNNKYDYSSRFSTAANQQYNLDTYSQAVTWATALTSVGGSLTKIDTSGTLGTLILAAAETYTGPTVDYAGTLQFGNGTAGFDGSLVNSPSIVDGGNVAWNIVGNQTYAGNITGIGLLNKSGVGNLTLSGTNYFIGASTVSAGMLEAINPTSLPNYGNAAKVVVAAGATVAVQTGNGIAGWSSTQIDSLRTAATWTNNTSILGIDTTNGNFTYASNITQALGLNKLGANTLFLTGNNTYTGIATITTGTLEAGNATSLPNYATAGKVVVAAGATAAVQTGNGTLGWSSTQIDNLRGCATWTSNTSTLGLDTTNGNFTYASNITQALAVTKLGTNVLTLSGVNTYSGGTTITSGGLAVASGSATGTGAVTVNSGAILGGNGTMTPTAAAGTLISIASGAHLAPSFSAAGTTTTLNASVSASASATAFNIAGGSIFDYNFAAPGTSDSLNVTGNVTLAAGNDTLNINQLSGFGLGNYTLIAATSLADSAGNWTLPSSVLYKYSVLNSATTLTLNVALNGPVTVTWNGNNSANWDTVTPNWQGSALYAGNDTVVFDDSAAGSYTVNVVGTVSPGNVTVNNSTNAYSIGGGIIGGNASLTKNGTNTLTLTGANTFSGGTTVNAGLLDVATATNGLASGSNVTNYAALQFDGSQALATITGNGTTTITGNGSLSVTSFSQSNLVNNGAFSLSGTATISTAISGTGNMSVSSTGSLTANAFAQTALVNNGTVQINGTGTIGQLTGAGNLTIGTGSSNNTVQLTQNVLPNSFLHTQQTLTISSGSTLDITNNQLLLNYGSGSTPLAEVQAAVASGAITSSTATGGLPGQYAVGYADATEIGSIPSNNVEVMFTLAGDANLDGVVNFNDYSVLQNAYNQTGRDWAQGDFNYDGSVNFNDYSILQNNYGQTLAGVVSGSAIIKGASKSLIKTSGSSTIVGAALAANGLTKLSSSIAPATTPTVTYVLSVNDDGTGHYSAGHYAVYASDSTNNGGLASYDVSLGGTKTLTNYSPKGNYDDGSGCGTDDEMGFVGLRSANNVSPATGTQDTAGYAGGSGVILVYGFGQTAGNLGTKTNPGSTGADGSTTQAVYGTPLELIKGSFSSGTPSFTSTGTDTGNVFLTTTGYGTEAPTLTFSTVTLPSGVAHSALLTITASGSASPSYIGTSNPGGQTSSSTITVVNTGVGYYIPGLLNGINAGNATRGAAKISGFSGTDAEIIAVAISVTDAGNATLHTPSAQELADIITDLNASPSLPGGATVTVEAYNGTTAGTLQHDNFAAFTLLNTFESTYGGQTLELAVLVSGVTPPGTETFGLNFASESVDGITAVDVTDIAVVPEPASMSLLLLGGLPLLGRRRRRHS